MNGRRRPFLRPTPTARVAACAAAGTLLISGCGILSGSSNGSRDEPITIMTWAPDDTNATNMPGMPAMAQAYARWVNDKGGIHGRELRVLTCNERNDAIAAAQCARRAADEKAVAVVGSYSQHGRSFMSPLEAAGIPYIGGYGLSEEEFTSPFSYPVNGGQAALLAGNGRQLASVCGAVSLVRPDTIAGDELPELLDAGLAEGNRSPAADIRAPEDASDYTRQAQQALSGAGSGGDSTSDASTGTGTGTGTGSGTGVTDGTVADTTGSGPGCVTAALGKRTNTFFDSFRRVQEDDSRVRIASILGSVRQSLVDSTGGRDSALEGTYATGWYPVADDPRWKPMHKIVHDYAFDDNRIDIADPGVQTTWIAYTVLRSVLTSLDPGKISAHAVRTTLDRGHATDTGGLTPKLRWRFQDLLPIRDYPRIVNANVTYQVVKDGKLVAVRQGFVDVGQTLVNRKAA
ncbi:ABC transporter substrate-binding protein [Streptomyces buecherae]|uniref:ABC transporter substrate-binding protein n=1 Tax=Streptomyces buecherae TaxID=2763006 RepID=UPI003647795B